MGLIADLGPGPVALDTAVLIYWIEEHPRYLGLLEPLFQRIDAGDLAATTSTLSLMEVLVVPYRAGHADLAQRYEALLSRSRGLRLIDLSRTVLRAAAQLRAVRPTLRTPDALQLACALSARCTHFLSNDRHLPDLPGLTVCQLDDYL